MHQELPHRATGQGLGDHHRQEVLRAPLDRPDMSSHRPHQVTIGSVEPLQRTETRRRDIPPGGDLIEPSCLPDVQGLDVLGTHGANVRDRIQRGLTQPVHQEEHRAHRLGLG